MNRTTQCTVFIPRIFTLIVAIAVTVGIQPLQAQRLTLSTDSEEAKTAFLTGLKYLQNFERAEAHDAFGRAVALDSGFALAKAMHVTTDYNKSGIERGALMGDAIIELADASTGELMFALARRARITRGNVAANPLYAAAKAVVPDDPFIAQYYAVTRNAFVFGRDERIKAFQQVIDRFPEYAPPYNHIAYERWHEGNHAGALQTVEKFLALASNSPNAHDSYAEIMQWSGLLHKALEHNKIARELSPRWTNAHSAIADVQQLMGNGKAARQTLTEGLEAAATLLDRWPLLRSMAFSYFRDDDLENGMATLKQLVDESGEAGFVGWDAHALLEMAVLDALLGDGSNVDAYFARSEELRPDAEYRHSWYALAYAELGRLHEARRASETYARAFPNDGNWNKTSEGMLLLQEGRVGEAIETLIQSGLSDTWSQVFMARAQAAAGNESDRLAMDGLVRNSTVLSLWNSAHTIPLLMLDH